MYISTFGLVVAVAIFLWVSHRKDKDINALRHEAESLRMQLETATENLERYYRLEDRARESIHYVTDLMLKASTEDKTSAELFKLYCEASKATDYFNDDGLGRKDAPWL
ncbi:hypothetical protein NMD10_27690 (plasmid) [Citrobacter portucalensis]|uniref:hypothetical protein n=1 Tax=Citrobacter portucalensis TaxID=1639133 RepID=UPI00351CEE80